jgi:hypothetical protein
MISDITAAFKSVLEQLDDVQVYDFVPDSQNLPCVIVYPENIELDVPNRFTFIVWAMTGKIDERGAQDRLSEWLSPDGDIIAALNDNLTLDGVVDSCSTLEVRNWRPAVVADGRPAYWQAELVCEVLT